MIKLRLFSRKMRTRTTLFGKTLILTVLVIISIFILRGLDKFLSVTDPVISKIMAVEGFLPDHTLKNLLTVFYDEGYEQMIIVGKPIGQGYYISGYHTSADLMRSTLMEMGLDSSLIMSISIPEIVFRDRTYSTGLLLFNWLDTAKFETKNVNIYTLGTHARRSKLLFKKAVGNEYEIGIISGKDQGYDQNKWWKSSKGFRTVLNESLAYFYARFFFYPDKEQALNDLELGYFIDEIQYQRNDKDIAFSKAESSPITDEQIKTFVKLNYFSPDPTYKVKGTFVKDTSNYQFEMKTSTDRLPLYSTFGKIHFQIDSVDYVISAYQNVELVKRPGYEHHLFIPFRDLTCGEESYGGGRYIDFWYDGSSSQVELDFNLSYNPLCAYNHRYSCPIPPFENHLNVRIEAGEKNYEDH